MTNDAKAAYQGVTSEQDDRRRNLQLYKIEGLIRSKPKNPKVYADSVTGIIEQSDSATPCPPPPLSPAIGKSGSLLVNAGRPSHKASGRANDSSLFLRQWGDIQGDGYDEAASPRTNGRRRLNESVDPKSLFVSRWVRDPETNSMELMVDRRPGMASHFAVTAPASMDFHDVYRREKRACRSALHLQDQLEQKGALVARGDATVHDDLRGDEDRALEIPETENEWFMDPKLKMDSRTQKKGLDDHLNRRLEAHESTPSHLLGQRIRRQKGIHPSVSTLGSLEPAVANQERDGSNPEGERRCRRRVLSQWMPREGRRLQDLLKERENKKVSPEEEDTERPPSEHSSPALSEETLPLQS
eukprot:Gregarina_sp_Poly_1__8209@NODE_476_length_8095_cov_200_606004_g385_i0_p4_GENE_NODE_476_length_8095_cov_200_606004_g385_i0NODE_476_length_8095_cov_200_606004_g385_i0_p4_ORF_typecomplete_len357_score76_05_NODE_476_length_8095_cov_200_606004_g385_i042995369